MTDTPLLKVGVWERLTVDTFGKVGELQTWARAEAEPRYLDAGSWSLDAQLDAQVRRVDKAHLLTFDLPRSDGDDIRLLTGVIERDNTAVDSTTGLPTRSMGGPGALALLGDTVCWPDPTTAIASQPAYYTGTAAAETALRNLILANVVTRRGEGLVIAASSGRGASITLNERFTNLLAVVSTKAEAAGLGVRMGLVDTSSTRAEMRLVFTEPADRSLRARLSTKVNTLRSWSATREAPTATRAIVGGSGAGAARVFRTVTDSAAETEWARKREVFVDARDIASTTELDARGFEALAEAVGRSSFDLESVEAEGMRFGTHFDLGDTVTVELGQESYTETLRAVKVTAGEAGRTVQLVPGSPDAGNPLLKQAALIRETRRRVGALERKE